MKILTLFLIILLTNLVLGARISHDKLHRILIKKKMFPEKIVLYTGKHEIVNLLFPINGINNKVDEETGFENNMEKASTKKTFLVEADIDSNGKRIDQGLYVLEHGHATKLLEHGRDAAASSDQSTLAFFGASDGIYIYNQENNSADKYGTVDDSIIAIATVETGDVIYILNENQELFKVSNNGTTKEKIDDVINAKQFVLDYYRNIYFYSDDMQAHVRTADGVKKITGLPENPSSVRLIEAPFILEDGVPFLVNNDVYFIFANRTSKHSGISFNPDARPSAFSPEAYMTQLYAYEKKIYEYYIMDILFGEVEDELLTYVAKATRELVPQRMTAKTRFHY